MKDQLFAKDWMVYSKRPFNGPEKVLDYLGRYTHRVAISNHRIVNVENGKVSIEYRDRKDKGKQKVFTLEANEFIRRFLLHLLPKGFMRIRQFGFLANKSKKRCLNKFNELMGLSTELSEPEEKIQEVTEKSFTNPIDIGRLTSKWLSPIIFGPHFMEF